MWVSFLSTTPSLVSLILVPSPNSNSLAANRYFTRVGAIRYSKTKTDHVYSECGFHRRNVLKCIGATVNIDRKSVV